MIVIACAACMWSFGIFYVNTYNIFDQQGYIVCKSFMELVITQVRILKRLLIFENVFLVVVSMSLSIIISNKHNLIEKVGGIFLTTLFTIFVVDSIKLVVGTEHHVFFSIFKIILAIGLPFLFTYSISKERGWEIVFFRLDRYIFKKLGLHILNFYGILSVIFLLAIVVLFTRVGVRTENLVKKGGIKQDRFLYRASFCIPEVVASYNEYLSIKGFEKEKMQLKRFIVKFDLYTISKK
jgi:hypothetical protein